MPEGEGWQAVLRAETIGTMSATSIRQIACKFQGKWKRLKVVKEVHAQEALELEWKYTNDINIIVSS